MTAAAIYLDASALVKLLLDEQEGGDLRRYLAAHGRQATSIVGRVEVERVVGRRAPERLQLVARMLDDLTIVELDATVAEEAATVGPVTLRTLDAIHLASAAQLAADLEAFVTFDRRQAGAARALGMPVASPEAGES